MEPERRRSGVGDAGSKDARHTRNAGRRAGFSRFQKTKGRDDDHGDFHQHDARKGAGPCHV